MLGSVVDFIWIVLFFIFFFMSLGVFALSHAYKKNKVTNKKYFIYKLIKLSIILSPILSLFSGWNWVPNIFSFSIEQTILDE